MGVYFIVYFGFMVSGLILAIVALSSVQKLRREVEELHRPVPTP